MAKTMGRLVLLAVLGAFAAGGWAGCGADKMPGAGTGTGGGGGTPGTGPAMGSGGALGQTSATGLQFNGAITFVRVAR